MGVIPGPPGEGGGDSSSKRRKLGARRGDAVNHTLLLAGVGLKRWEPLPWGTIPQQSPELGALG